MTERPNDPAAGLSDASFRARNVAGYLPGPASTGRVNGRAAHPDVASFVAARTAAMATPEPADDPGTDGRAEPSSPLDPPPLDPSPVDPPPLDPSPRPDHVTAPPPPRLDARPRIVEDPVILGLTRVSRSRLGSRLFMLFFVFVYVVILAQLIVSLLQT